MDGQSLGTRIREFLRGLFGSRAAERAEAELMRCRNDYETRLHERDLVIAGQNERIAALEGKVERYELVLIPLASPSGSLLAPKRTPPAFEPVLEPSSWQSVREAHERAQAEDGPKEN